MPSHQSEYLYVCYLGGDIIYQASAEVDSDPDLLNKVIYLKILQIILNMKPIVCFYMFTGTRPWYSAELKRNTNKDCIIAL